MVTNQIVSDKGKETIATKLLTAGTDKPIGIIEPKQNEGMPVEGGGSKAKWATTPCTRLTRPRGAKLDQNGRASLVVRPQCEVGRSAGCMALGAAHRRASATGITVTARVPGKR